MAIRKHNRTYDLVVYGASGYTGLCVCEHVANSLPSNLKWALAGRSETKLTQVAAGLEKLNRDRIQPAIEVCSNSNEDLEQLAKKTCVLITTVGPYGAYGEPAFRACALNGTHYFDVTGETAFVARMIRKYEAAAKESGAMMWPQCGIESAPADLVTWAVAKVNRVQLWAPTGDVTVSVKLSGAPSGGTLLTVFTLLDNFSLKEVRESFKPYAMSPVPHPNPRRGSPSLLDHLIGVRTVPGLGVVTTSMAATTDAALIERSWGLFASLPARKNESYGPNFSFSEYMKVRNWLEGIVVHIALMLGALALFGLPPVRWLAKKLATQPGSGPSREDVGREALEFRAVGKPDIGTSGGKALIKAPRKQALCQATYNGSLYLLTGILVSEGAMAVLEDDTGLSGGIFTPSCLGQGLIDRLDRVGFRFESKLIDV